MVFVYADGCTGACEKAGPNSATELLTLARQSSGPRLFAAYDGPDLPAAPRLDASYANADETEVVLSWQEPDDHGSAVYEYRVYRYFVGDSGAEQIGTVINGSASFTDTVAAGDQPRYRVTAVNAFGEGGSCMWIGPTLKIDLIP